MQDAAEYASMASVKLPERRTDKRAEWRIEGRKNYVVRMWVSSVCVSRRVAI